MRKRQLTEAQAWRVIAEKLLNAGEVEDGLCKEARLLSDAGEITWQVRCRMAERMTKYKYAHEDVTGLYRTYIYPEGEYHEERAMVALWMALEAASEAKEEARA